MLKNVLCALAVLLCLTSAGRAPPLARAAAPTAAPSIPTGLSFQAYVDLGTRHFRAGQYDLAAQALEAALKKEQPARLFFNLARAYHKAGRLSEALAQYERYLKAEPLSPRRAEVDAYCEALRAELNLRRVPSPREAALGLDQAPVAPKPPLYKRGWFWGVVVGGVVIVGTGITLGVVLGRR